MAAPPPPPVTFRDLYQDPTQDSHGGNYTAVMAEFQVQPAAAGWNRDTKLAAVLNVGTSCANAYVGLFPFGAGATAEAAGRTRLLHAPQRFPTTLGIPTPHDGVNYTFTDDVVGGMVPTVVFPNNAFEPIGAGGVRVPRTIAIAAALWAADADLTIIDRLAAGADIDTAYVPRITFVPQPYIHLLLGRRLTPRQLVNEVLAQVAADGREIELAPFVKWCLLAGVAATRGDAASPLLAAADVTAPLTDASLLRFIQGTLQRMLPGHGTAPVAATLATVRIAGLMNDMLTEQRNTRDDAVLARTAASAPKTVYEFFKQYATDKLMLMCNTADEDALPTLWQNLAAANGKREREVIEEDFRRSASAAGLNELTPVVTPSLAKKITGMRFSGSNIDDLAEGLNPFAMIIMDHTTANGTLAYNEALLAAHDYDDVMRGSNSADLQDIQTLKSSSKVIIPETYALGRAMLQSFRIVLVSVLGEAHNVVTSYTRFLTTYMNRENFFIGRLQRADPSLGIARLLRYVQLVFRAWFDAKWTFPAADVGEAFAPPDLVLPFTRMTVGDMTWLPEIPGQYLMPAAAPSPASTAQKVLGKEKAKPIQVRNTKPNVRFDDFKTAIINNKFNDIIKKVGPPPSVTRKGKEITMCASYHLRHSCFDTCGRAADHGTHSEAEDNALYEWCKKAFE